MRIDNFSIMHIDVYPTWYEVLGRANDDGKAEARDLKKVYARFSLPIDDTFMRTVTVGVRSGNRLTIKSNSPPVVISGQLVGYDEYYPEPQSTSHSPCWVMQKVKVRYR